MIVPELKLVRELDLERQLEASDARYQERIRELEEALWKIHTLFEDSDDTSDNAVDVWPYMIDIDNYAMKALSTTTPDQALQRAILGARIDELESLHRYPTGNVSNTFVANRIEELRAKRNELTTKRDAL